MFLHFAKERYSVLLCHDFAKTDIPEEKKEIIEPEKLPSYELATTLPSYEDAQRIEENEVRNDLIKLFFHLDVRLVFALAYVSN